MPFILYYKYIYLFPHFADASSQIVGLKQYRIFLLLIITHRQCCRRWWYLIWKLRVVKEDWKKDWWLIIDGSCDCVTLGDVWCHCQCQCDNFKFRPSFDFDDNYEDVLLYFSTLRTPSLRSGWGGLASWMNGVDHDHDDCDSFLLTANAHIRCVQCPLP